jgi:endonuclease III
VKTERQDATRRALREYVPSPRKLTDAEWSELVGSLTTIGHRRQDAERLAGIYGYTKES